LIRRLSDLLPNLAARVPDFGFVLLAEIWGIEVNYRILLFGFVAGVAMSDSEEHHFESKADAGASKTYPQQAGTIRKNGFIVIKGRPCKVYTRFDLGSSLGL